MNNIIHTIPSNKPLNIQFTWSKRNDQLPNIKFGCLQLNEYGYLTDLLFDSYQNNICQLKNHQHTLSIRSNNQKVEEENEYSQEFIIKPSIDSLFNIKSSNNNLYDNSLKSFLKDFQKVTNYNNNNNNSGNNNNNNNNLNQLYHYVMNEIFQSKKKDIFKELGMKSFDDNIDDNNIDNNIDSSNITKNVNNIGMIDALGTYKGNTKMIIFYLEGDLKSILTPQSSIVMEWSTSLQQLDNSINNSIRFNYNDLISNNSIFSNGYTIYITSCLFLDTLSNNNLNSNLSFLVSINKGFNNFYNIIDIYQNGLIHSLIDNYLLNNTNKEIFTKEEISEIIEKPFKYFEPKKNHSIILDSNTLFDNLMIDINYSIIGKKFNLNHHLLFLDKSNSVLKFTTFYFGNNENNNLIDFKYLNNNSIRYFLNLKDIPEMVDKIIIISSIDDNTQNGNQNINNYNSINNFLRVKDFTLKIMNEKYDLISCFFSQPGMYNYYIWGMLKRCHLYLDNNKHHSQQSLQQQQQLIIMNNLMMKWEFLFIDEYLFGNSLLDIYSHLYNYLFKNNLPNIDTCPMLSTTMNLNVKTTIEFENEIYCKLKFKNERLLNLLKLKNNGLDEMINLEMSFFDELGYHLITIKGINIYDLFHFIFKFEFPNELIFQQSKSAFLKISFNLPEMIDYNNNINSNNINLEESIKLIMLNDNLEDLFGIIIDDKIVNTINNLSSYCKEWLCLKMEKMDNSLWKVSPIGKDLTTINDNIEWIEYIHKELLNYYISNRPQPKILLTKDRISLPLQQSSLQQSNIYYKKEYIGFNSFISISCQLDDNNNLIKFQPRINLLTNNNNNIIEITKKNNKYIQNNNGNNTILEILTNKNDFILFGEYDNYQIIFKDYELQHLFNGLILELILNEDLNITINSKIIIKYFNHLFNELFRIIIDPIQLYKNGNNWNKKGDCLSILSIMKELITQRWIFTSIKGINVKDFKQFMIQSPKFIKIYIEKLNNLFKKLDSYIFIKFDDGKKNLNIKKTNLLITKIIEKENNPIFNESLSIKLVGDLRNDHRVLAIHILGKKSVGKEYIGWVTIPLKEIMEGNFIYDIQPNNLKQKKQKQMDKAKGQLYITFEYIYK
ncbi:hypothetical protein ABK040_004201 [Willaertia magna]